MNRRIATLAVAAVLAGSAAAIPAASARSFVAFSVGVPAVGYVAPAPYYPAPVAYPAPAYYPAAPTYYPAPVAYAAPVVVASPYYRPYYAYPGIRVGYRWRR
jgi:hypothetical protein